MPPFCYKTLFEKNFLQKIMKSDLQNIVDEWVDDPTPDLEEVSVVTVKPDFDTPLPPSYPRQDPPMEDLKEEVRVAANTANKLTELGMDADQYVDTDNMEEDSDDLLKAADLFEKAFGKDSLNMDTAKNFVDADGKKTKKPKKTIVADSSTVVAPQMYNTYTAMKLATILNEYDHKVVEDTAQMRTYVTNKLLEISSCGDSKQELRALELLGKISDVGLFSEKTEINVNHTTDQLEHAIKDKINRLMGQVHDAEFEEVPTLEVIEEEPDGSEERSETS